MDDKIVIAHPLTVGTVALPEAHTRISAFHPVIPSPIPEETTTLSCGTRTTTLSVLMPILNERNTLLPLLARIQAVPVQKEILIVDDGSTDGTRELLASQVDGRAEGVRVFYHDRNRGKGAAIRTAIPHATGDFCIVQDGDLEYDPNDYLAIVRAFDKSGVSVVYGSRFVNGFPSMRLPNVSLDGSRLFSHAHHR